MKAEVVVFGSGSFADYVAYLFEHDSPYRMAAFCVDALSDADAPNAPGAAGRPPTVDLARLERDYPADRYAMFVAIESIGRRRRVFDLLRGKGYELASLVSSKALYWENLTVGDNVLVSEGSVIQPYVTIGDNSILNISTVGHHSRIGRDCSLSCCTLGGNVTVSDRVFIGLSTVVRHNTRVAPDSFIGMGAVINSDTTEGSVYSEKPTRKRRVSSYRFKNKYL